MKHWYKSAPMKGILLILEHIFAVLAVLCVVFILIYPLTSVLKSVMAASS